MSDQQLTLGRAAPVPHTPAPWRVSREPHGWRITGPSPRPADQPMEWFIAKTISNEPEDEANARLIGVAPALLRHARGAWHLCQSLLASRDGVTEDLIRELADALQADITQAEG